MKGIAEVKEKIDKVFYSVPQPTKLKEEYEKVWQGITAGIINGETFG